MNASELFQEEKDELDEDWHETFDELTAQGRSPSGIKAAIEYVTTQKTQQEVALEYNVSQVTIRNLQAAVVALGPIDSKTESTHAGDSFTVMEYCTQIADRLAWEEGTHYRVNEDVNGTQQPDILKNGWKSVYHALVEEQE